MTVSTIATVTNLKKNNDDDDVPQVSTSMVPLLTPPIISSSGIGDANGNKRNGSDGKGETQ